jgi:hypothetical protein
VPPFCSRNWPVANLLRMRRIDADDRDVELAGPSGS